MKNLVLLFMLIFFSWIPQSAYPWDSTAAKFYPLAVGNVWSYHQVVLGPMNCYMISNQYDFIVRIDKDTIMPNGKKYFNLGNTNLYQNGYQRVDSLTMNVYKWKNGAECLIDSLLAKIGDTSNSCRAMFGNYRSVFHDTIRTNFAGQNRLTRLISGNPLIGESYYLMEKIGYSAHFECEFGGSRTTLNGCIINGIQYGNIVGSEGGPLLIPVNYFLYQNYPNPFNPATLIRFAVPLSKGGLRGLFVSLIVYDILGRQAAVLVNDRLNPGTYEIEWDASSYSSGLYLYKLESDEYTETKKMLLLK